MRSLKLFVARLLMNAALGALPGIVLFCLFGHRWAISLGVLGAIVGLGLALPNTSAYDVFRRVVISIVPVPLPEDSRPRKDDFTGWMLRGKANPVAAGSILLGAILGVIGGAIFLAVDLSLFLKEGESHLLPTPRVSHSVVYIFTYFRIVATTSAVFGLLIFGSHWNPILILGGFAFVVAFFMGFGVGPAERSLRFGLGGSSIGLGLGALLGFFAASNN